MPFLRCVLILLLSLLSTLTASVNIPLTSQNTAQATQRIQFLAAWEAAKHGPAGLKEKLSQGLENYPLYPYVELAAMQQRLPQLKGSEVEEALTRWPDLPITKDLREAYLRQLAKSEQWKDFSELYRDTTNRELRCHSLIARIKLGQKLDFSEDIEPLWLSATSLPNACDNVMTWARAQKILSVDLIWKRINLATNAGNIALVSSLGQLLEGKDRQLSDQTVVILRDPAAELKKANSWPDNPHTRNAIVAGLERLSKKSTDNAELLWKQLEKHFQFDNPQRYRVLRALALAHATDFSPNALAYLTSLPNEANNDITREWRVRSALVADKPEMLLTALEALSDTQKSDARWRYLHARTLTKTGQQSTAESIFSSLAKETHFYGFLAADELNRPYTICSQQIKVSPSDEQKVSTLPGLIRALEWFALERPSEARREWDNLIPRLDSQQRRIAVDIAAKAGWNDRAAFTFTQGEELRFYELRFPLAQQKEVEQAATETGLDPAFPYAIIRAESAWMVDAKSPANAYGLMQLLPSTATEIAKSAKLNYSGASDLFKPDLNIQLGTRYLEKISGKFQGSPWLTSAAYNAGSNAVTRWLTARSSYDPDFFIETIPYKETREYVARVLTFSVIYDWRLHGNALPISTRLPRIGETYTLPDKNTARKSVVCLANADKP